MDDKNNETQEFKGRNLEDAISLAEHVLKTPRTQFTYEIVAEKTKLFGIKTKEIVIQTWPKKAISDTPPSKLLNEILEKFPLELRYHAKEKNGIAYYIFEGPDKHLLLRKDGALLLAFQHILNKVSEQKIQVDCDFFRKRKERELRELGQRTAQRVKETREDALLDFMNPYERRIIHVVANQVNGVATESLGQGFLKRVKVYFEKR